MIKLLWLLNSYYVVAFGTSMFFKMRPVQRQEQGKRLCTEVDMANKDKHCLPAYCIIVNDPNRSVLPECHALPKYRNESTSLTPEHVTEQTTASSTTPTLYPPSEDTATSLHTNLTDYTEDLMNGSRIRTSSTRAPYDNGDPPTGRPYPFMKCHAQALCEPMFYWTGPDEDNKFKGHKERKGYKGRKDRPRTNV